MQGRVKLLLMGWLLLPSLNAAVWAETMQFIADRDNTLYEDVEGDISNGAGEAIFMGRIGENDDFLLRRSLVRFDVSVIPSEAIIESVEVSFAIVFAPMVPEVTGGMATLHRVLADWGEGASDAFPPEGQGAPAQPGDATWIHRFFDTNNWNSDGGDFEATASASQGYGLSAPETLAFTSTESLINDVRAWVHSPAVNFGWILRGNEGSNYTARKIDSREALGGTPATLTVDYRLPSPTDDLELELLTTVPVRPVAIANAGDDSNRLFIVEQEGIILIYDLETDVLLNTPFLDISSSVDDGENEQGLLGLAFHPDYENNGQFYVNYTYDPPGGGDDRTRIAMYQVSAGDPNIADALETVILEFEQSASNHNGGDIHFDPDGLLVIASGDGGGSNDPDNSGQTLTTLLGKMLRIDIDGGVRGSVGNCGLVQNYGIPEDNPYVGNDEGCDEILHWGMRNPWRFSFDGATGDMFIGDVGQGLWEEISLAAVGTTDINFGWKRCEGRYLRGSDSELCEFGELPIIDYSSSGTGNCSVTGGYVYRGSNTNLQGRYIYADYCSARIWIATKEGNTWTSEEWMETPGLESVSTFGQDENCELYIADFGSLGANGDESIYRIVNNEILDESGFEEIRCHQ